MPRPGGVVGLITRKEGVLSSINQISNIRSIDDRCPHGQRTLVVEARDEVERVHGLEAVEVETVGKKSAQRLGPHGPPVPRREAPQLQRHL